MRQLKLRVLTELDSLDAVAAEAERWFQTQPGSEEAYREVARVFERAFGPDRALEVLARARTATGDPQALALEMGDVLAAARRLGPALEEWGRAVGDDGARAALVSRRLAGLPGDAQAAARQVVSALGRAPSPGRRQAAVQIALDLKLGREAMELAPRAMSGLDEGARTAFLADVARRARERGLGDVATWAYGELGEGAGTPVERRQFDQRLVEMALAAGDTVRALEAQGRVVASFTRGSVDRRRAAALQIGLRSAGSSPQAILADLADFRAEFPEAPEVDGLAAGAALALASRGDREGATAVLAGLEGPLTSLEWGYLLLAEGATTEGKEALLVALSGVEPGVATGVIQLVALLDRLSREAGQAVGRASALAHHGRGVEATRLLMAVADSLPGGDRAPLLAQAARLADTAGEGELAAEVRQELLRDHPDVPEAQDAALALARHAAGVPERRQEAVRLLEELVARWPASALAPDARRELERLRRAR